MIAVAIFIWKFYSSTGLLRKFPLSLNPNETRSFTIVFFVLSRGFLFYHQRKNHAYQRKLVETQCNGRSEKDAHQKEMVLMLLHAMGCLDVKMLTLGLALAQILCTSKTCRSPFCRRCEFQPCYKLVCRRNSICCTFERRYGNKSSPGYAKCREKSHTFGTFQRRSYRISAHSLN